MAQTLTTDTPDRAPADSATIEARNTDDASIDALHRWISTATEVCSAASRGDLEARILHIPESERVSAMLHSINQLLDMTDAFVREASATLEYASKGKFFRRVVSRGMLGTFGRAAVCINTATEHMAHEAQALREAESRRKQLVENFGATAEVVHTLEQASREIGNVVEVIRKIASQTSLLALNASIEAARVGEMGRGFAVVANEVKSLAQQTADATNSIQQQIGAIQSAARNTVAAIDHIAATIGDASGRTGKSSA